MKKQPLGETKGERKKRYSLSKGFIYYLTGLLTHAVLLLCSLIPERAFVYCVKRGAALYVFVVRRYRKRIAKNLKIAFGPSFRPEDIESLMKALGNHLGLSIAEMFYSASPKHKDLADRIRIQGAEHLEKALAMGKGVIAVSAHLGNFTLIGMKMLEEGYPCSMLVKDPKSKPLANALRTLQKRQQGRFIYVEPWKEALRRRLAQPRY